jgi:hypothetical protein
MERRMQEKEWCEKIVERTKTQGLRRRKKARKKNGLIARRMSCWKMVKSLVFGQAGLVQPSGPSPCALR